MSASPKPDKDTLKVIRIVEKKATREERLLSSILWLGSVCGAFYVNHAYIGGSTLLGLFLFGLGVMTLVALGKMMSDTEAVMTPDEALAWLQANLPKKDR